MSDSLSERRGLSRSDTTALLSAILTVIAVPVGTAMGLILNWPQIAIRLVVVSGCLVMIGIVWWIVYAQAVQDRINRDLKAGLTIVVGLFFLGFGSTVAIYFLCVPFPQDRWKRLQDAIDQRNRMIYPSSSGGSQGEGKPSTTARSAETPRRGAPPIILADCSFYIASPSDSRQQYPYVLVRSDTRQAGFAFSPPSEFLGKSYGSGVYRCSITNKTDASLIDVHVFLRETYWRTVGTNPRGEIDHSIEAPEIITELDPGDAGRFLFFAVSGGKEYAELSFPNTVTARKLGEDRRFSLKFVTTEATETLAFPTD
jgi:hypothetical protein